MTLPRIVGAESLDTLAGNDPAAMRSRRDLRRVHRAMGTRAIVVRALRDMALRRPDARPLRVLELGAGDGSLMLGVARCGWPSWRDVELTLLDRQALIDQATIAGYAKAGWSARARVVDVLDWAGERVDSDMRPDLVIANLFMHHFESAQLAGLLRVIAARTDRFLACEPSRSWLALAGSHLVGTIGANAVTRADAVLSVHAGFCANELSDLWPADGAPWRLREYSAGLFSHCFSAARAGAC